MVAVSGRERLLRCVDIRKPVDRGITANRFDHPSPDSPEYALPANSLLQRRRRDGTRPAADNRDTPTDYRQQYRQQEGTTGTPIIRCTYNLPRWRRSVGAGGRGHRRRIRRLEGRFRRCGYGLHAMQRLSVNVFVVQGKRNRDDVATTAMAASIKPLVVASVAARDRCP